MAHGPLGLAGASPARRVVIVFIASELVAIEFGSHDCNASARGSERPRSSVRLVSVAGI